MIPFSTSAMDQILAREPKMAISGPFPGIFRRKIYKNPASSRSAMGFSKPSWGVRRGGGGRSKPPKFTFLPLRLVFGSV